MSTNTIIKKLSGDFAEQLWDEVRDQCSTKMDMDDAYGVVQPLVEEWFWEKFGCVDGEETDFEAKLMTTLIERTSDELVDQVMEWIRDSIDMYETEQELSRGYHYL